jgi:hypothetical protein
LLIGGDKTGDKRFHDWMVLRADDLYDEHLAELQKEKDDWPVGTHSRHCAPV